MYLGDPVSTINLGHPCEVCGAPATCMTGGTAPHYYCGLHNPALAPPMHRWPNIIAGSTTVPTGGWTNAATSAINPFTIAKSEVWAAIERFRVHLRETGRDSDDDVILELMDYLIGWCGPIPGRGVLKEEGEST